MMEFINEKYFGYIAASYGITSLVFIGFIIWVLLQHRAHRAELSRLEELGITRRSSGKPSKGGRA